GAALRAALENRPPPTVAQDQPPGRDVDAPRVVGIRDRGRAVLDDDLRSHRPYDAPAGVVERLLDRPEAREVVEGAHGRRDQADRPGLVGRERGTGSEPGRAHRLRAVDHGLLATWHAADQKAGVPA